MIFNSICFNLAKYILLIESKKEKIHCNKYSNKLNLCNCRNKLIDIYLTNCQIMLIKITSLILKYYETKDDDKFYLFLKDIEDWFYKSNYFILNLKDLNIHHHSLDIFKLLQKRIDEKMFNYIKINLLHHTKEYLSSKDLEKNNQFYKTLCDWFELSIFTFVTISKLKCENFNCFSKQINKTNKNDNIKHYKQDNTSNNIVIKCNIDDLLKDNKEMTKLIYCTEIINNDPDFYYDWLTILVNCYKNYKNVTVIFDFKLIDKQYYFNENDYKTFEIAINNFNEVYVYNYENINFNEYYDKMKYFLINKEQINNN